MAKAGLYKKYISAVLYFFRYEIMKSGNVSFKMAEPEKAMLDFLFFRSDIKNNNDIDELRINWDIYREKIDKTKMEKYLTVYNSKVLYQKFIKINKKSGSSTNFVGISHSNR